MAGYFADSSAIIKCYVAEVGSAWMNALVAPASEPLILLARIATVEVPAGMARRHREASLADSVLIAAVESFRHDLHVRYRLIETDETVCDLARELVIRHPFRAYDAIQLASALRANQVLTEAALSPLVFLSADLALNRIAQAEGLAVDDPNNHP